MPANVREELDDWAGHSEKFILYEGFGLLDGQRQIGGMDRFVIESISPDLALVRGPEKLYQSLEATEQVPTRIRHADQALWFADAEAHDAFAKLLLDAKCVVPTDRRALTVTYPKKAELLVQDCLKRLKQKHAVVVEDVVQT